MLVDIVLLAAVAGVVVSRGPARSRGLETRAAAGSLAGALRTARARAMERAETVGVAIDPARHLYAIDGGVPVALAPDLSVEMQNMGPGRPGGARVVRFAPDGSASGGTILLGKGAHRLRVEVEWLSGAVRVADAG